MGEKADGEEPVLSHKKITDWAPTARGSGVRPGHGENDDITASQEGPGVAESARGVVRVEEHGDSSGASRSGREASPRGVRDQTGEVFRAAAFCS